MEPDFKKIENELVGYKTRKDCITDPIWLESLTFKDFIPPYANKAKTLRQVYKNLKQKLNFSRGLQDSVTDKKRSISVDVLATATLQREAMMNSMNLIKENYL